MEKREGEKQCAASRSPFGASQDLPWDRVTTPASQNSSQRKANSSAVHCITRGKKKKKNKSVLVLGAEWLPANFGIKVEQRIPGGERGLGGEETGSSEQQRGQAGRRVTIPRAMARRDPVSLPFAQHLDLPQGTSEDGSDPRRGGCLDSRVIKNSPRRGFFCVRWAQFVQV